MKFTINIEKKYASMVIGLLILGIGIFVVNALASGIDTNKGYHESNQVSVSVSGVEKTLQEAIDDGSIGSDTNANTICSGTSTYLDGEGNCDSASAIVSAGGGATPPTCTGDGKCLQFDGSNWICADCGTDIIGFPCGWTGWYPETSTCTCIMGTYQVACGATWGDYTCRCTTTSFTQNLCESGVITDSRTASSTSGCSF